jgi:hypothetical protein
MQCIHFFAHLVQGLPSESAHEINYPVALTDIHGFKFADMGLSGSWAVVEEVLHEEAGVPKSDIVTEIPLHLFNIGIVIS